MPLIAVSSLRKVSPQFCELLVTRLLFTNQGSHFLSIYGMSQKVNTVSKKRVG